MNILLDLYLEKNLGDDLFLQTILERYPNDNWYIMTQEDYTKMENIYSNLTVITLPKGINFVMHKTKLTHAFTKHITRKYAIAALATVGGSIFIEYDGWEKLYELRKKNWEYFIGQNKPVFVIGANFGPYHSAEFLQSYKSLFEKVTDICFRDQYSASIFNELRNIRCETDVVISYNTEPYNKIPIKKTIGISVMDLSSRPKLKHLQEKYLEKMVSLTQLLLKDGYEVYLMSFCHSEGDEKTSADIMEIIGENKKLNSLNYTGEVTDFLKTFSTFQAIIACRFHSAILSYIFSKPIVPIIYSKKTSDFITDWALTSDWIEMKEIELLSYEKISNRINETVTVNPKLIQSANRQFEALEQWMLKIKV